MMAAVFWVVSLVLGCQWRESSPESITRLPAVIGYEQSIVILRCFQDLTCSSKQECCEAQPDTDQRHCCSKWDMPPELNLTCDSDNYWRGQTLGCTQDQCCTDDGEACCHTYQSERYESHLKEPSKYNTSIFRKCASNLDCSNRDWCCIRNPFDDRNDVEDEDEDDEYCCDQSMLRAARNQVEMDGNCPRWEEELWERVCDDNGQHQEECCKDKQVCCYYEQNNGLYAGIIFGVICFASFGVVIAFTQYHNRRYNRSRPPLGPPIDYNGGSYPRQSPIPQSEQYASSEFTNSYQFGHQLTPDRFGGPAHFEPSPPLQYPPNHVLVPQLSNTQSNSTQFGQTTNFGPTATDQAAPSQAWGSQVGLGPPYSPMPPSVQYHSSTPPPSFPPPPPYTEDK